MKYHLALMAGLLLLFACSCNSRQDAVICTEEFRLIGVTVTGGELSDYCTVRETTKDTIRFTENQNYPLGSWYPILDDSYQPILEGIGEDFYFIGTIGDSGKFEQHYIIGADQCHIIKVLGPEKIEI